MLILYPSRYAHPYLSIQVYSSYIHPGILIPTFPFRYTHPISIQVYYPSRYTHPYLFIQVFSSILIHPGILIHTYLSRYTNPISIQVYSSILIHPDIFHPYLSIYVYHPYYPSRYTSSIHIQPGILIHTDLYRYTNPSLSIQVYSSILIHPGIVIHSYPSGILIHIHPSRHTHPILIYPGIIHP